MNEPRFSPGDKVHRSRKGSDYEFWGWVVGVITKRSGEVRYAVEDDRGRIFVIHPKDLSPGWSVETYADLNEVIYLRKRVDDLRKELDSANEKIQSLRSRNHP